MSRFYGTLTGSARTSVTRRGTPNSGISAHLRGWNLGVHVHVWAEGDTDKIDVWETGGSNASMTRRLLVSLTRTPDGHLTVSHPYQKETPQ